MAPRPSATAPTFWSAADRFRIRRTPFDGVRSRESAPIVPVLSCLTSCLGSNRRETMPLGGDAGDDLAILGVQVALLLRHRHEDGAVDAAGQLIQHLLLLSANEDRRECLAELVQV